MKKVLILILPLLIIGCTNKEKIFEEYAKEYYENHMKMIDKIDTVIITIDDLKNASSEDGYDMKPLQKCKNTSKITFEIDKTTKEIKNKKIDINC